MLFHYQKIRKITEVLNDLVKIHNDRIATYQLALNQSANLSPDIREEFNSFIYDGIYFKKQLNQKIKDLNGDTTKGTTIFGKIYTAWMDLRVVLSFNTQKAIISSCLYNEEIALQAFHIALDAKVEMSQGIRELIETQEDALRAVHGQIEKYRHTGYVADHAAVYFN